jgi:hypothetical protein
MDRIVLEKQAMLLEPAERALLADHLLQSLEDSTVLETWVEESERRSEAYQKGVIDAEDSDEVLANIRASIKG